MLETAICLPILLLLLLNVFDAATFFLDRLVLNQVAREGLRLAIVTPDFEFDDCTYDGMVYNGDGCLAPQRAMLASTYRALLIATAQLVSTSNFTVSSTGDATARTVKVAVEGRFNGVIAPFVNLRVKSEFSGPYI